MPFSSFQCKAKIVSMASHRYQDSPPEMVTVSATNFAVDLYPRIDEIPVGPQLPVIHNAASK